MVGNLFNQSNPQQQAGVLNQLVQAIGPGALSGVAGGILGRVLGGGQTPGTITPQQASQFSPNDVTAIAAHAQQQDPSIVDRVGSFYAQHPTLVKTLGAVTLSAVMGHLSANRDARPTASDEDLDGGPRGPRRVASVNVGWRTDSLWRSRYKPQGRCHRGSRVRFRG